MWQTWIDVIAGVCVAEGLPEPEALIVMTKFCFMFGIMDFFKDKPAQWSKMQPYKHGFKVDPLRLYPGGKEIVPSS